MNVADSAFEAAAEAAFGVTTPLSPTFNPASNDDFFLLGMLLPPRKIRSSKLVQLLSYVFYLCPIKLLNKIGWIKVYSFEACQSVHRVIKIS